MAELLGDEGEGALLARGQNPGAGQDLDQGAGRLLEFGRQHVLIFQHQHQCRVVLEVLQRPLPQHPRQDGQVARLGLDDPFGLRIADRLEIEAEVQLGDLGLDLGEGERV